MSLQSNFYPVPIVAGTTAGTYAAGDDPRLSNERTPPDDVVTNAKLSNVATSTIKGRATAGTGDPEDLTATQVRTILNVADGAEVNVNADWDASSGDAQILNKPTLATVATSGDYDDLTNKPSTFTPSTHASTHATGGSDAIAPSDIGAQSIFVTESLVITNTAQVNLTAARAKIFSIVQYAGQQVDVQLPSTGALEGDVFVFRWGTGSDSIRILNAVSGAPIGTISNGETKRFIRGSTSAWSLVPVDTHTHPATDITSGTLAHERGGLEADVSAYDGLLKISGGSTSAVTLSSAGEALLDDADAAAQRTTLGLGNSATLDTGTTAGTVAAGDHTHELNALDATGATDGHVLTADGAGGAAFEAIPSTALNDLSNVSAAAPSDNDVLVYDNATSTWVAEAPAAGGVSAIGTSAADVLSVSGSDLVADDGGTVDSADPFIKWDDTAGKLVYANPLSRPSGAMYIGLAPTTTALGTDAINIQTGRAAANQVASANESICIGLNARCTGTQAIRIGEGGIADYTGAIAIGGGAQTNGFYTIAIGSSSNAIATNSVAIGFLQTSSLNAQLVCRPFSAVYYGGQTTNATPTILGLDLFSGNRFTIAANTALAVDVLLVARRSDTADKWLVARRFLGIRRDGSNNTSLIGSVQTLGTDQSDGSPTWSFTLTADDTNEALQLEVTGAASETVQWRATAFYRVV